MCNGVSLISENMLCAARDHNPFPPELSKQLLFAHERTIANSVLPKRKSAEVKSLRAINVVIP